MSIIPHLIELAAEAVATTIKTSDARARVRAADDLLAALEALRDLGLSPDDAIDSIVNIAAAKLARLDVVGLTITPEAHDLDRHVRRILSADG
jgi:hypothetical protein